MVLQYAKGGNFDNYINNYVLNWFWHERLFVLEDIIRGLKKIHENNMVHRDFHTGNILSSFDEYYIKTKNPISRIYISDMGLCREISNTDETKIYGVMPYVAPEVLRGLPYTKAADIYSFGMIMYFIATKKQPFANCAHDNILALKICNGIRPEINDNEAPKCYINLMKRCWDANPDNRPNAIEIEELIKSFISNENNEEIKNQFEKAEEYRIANLLSIENDQSTAHPQAYYTSRLLNPYTKDLSKYDNISVEVYDFTAST
jgi:serine/threonine protein kinase